jgi:hypothetical protein
MGTEKAKRCYKWSHEQLSKSEETLAPESTTWHHRGTMVGPKENGAMNSSHKDKFGREGAR